MVSKLEQAVQAFREGQLVVIFDSEREQEGDFAVAAEKVTAKSVAMLAKLASGLVCLALPLQKLEQLGIPRLPRHNCLYGANFYMPVDLVGQKSGISAEERVQTIRAMIDPNTSLDMISFPGHLILLGAAPGGLRERRGHTEAAVELAKLAGLYPAAVISEAMDTSGEMKTGEDLLSFAEVLGLPVIDIRDLTKQKI